MAANRLVAARAKNGQARIVTTRASAFNRRLMPCVRDRAPCPAQGWTTSFDFGRAKSRAPYAQDERLSRGGRKTTNRAEDFARPAQISASSRSG